MYMYIYVYIIYMLYILNTYKGRRVDSKEV